MKIIKPFLTSNIFRRLDNIDRTDAYARIFNTIYVGQVYDVCVRDIANKIGRQIVR